MIALIPAAGSSSRMAELGPGFSKLTHRFVAGAAESDNSTGRETLSVLELTLSRLLGTELIKEIVLAVKPEEVQQTKNICQKLSQGAGLDVRVVSGGLSRQDSVAAALASAALSKDEFVLVHDACRPFFSTALIKRVYEAAKYQGAAIAALPLKGTLKQVADSGLIKSTLDRSQIWEAQTPQIFRKDLLLQAHSLAAEQNFQGTDESQLVERLGENVSIVLGEESNIKLTTPYDLLLGELISRQGHLYRAEKSD